MRRRTAIGILFTAALVLLPASSCIPSVYPLYTDRDLVTDARILGTWGEAEEPDESWTLSASDNAYQLAIVDQDSQWLYSAHLLKLGEHLFLDIVPNQPETAAGRDEELLNKLHVFLLVKPAADRLEISAPDLDEFQRRLADGTIQARTFDLDGGPVLSEPTPRLQRLVLELAATPGAFTEPVVLVRR